MIKTTIEQSIKQKLTDHFSPSYLAVINESGNHNVPTGSETHFKVIMVSDSFEGKRLVQRHRLVYELLSAELSAQVHALALHLYTLAEWQQQAEKAPVSPACRGGSQP